MKFILYLFSACFLFTISLSCQKELSRQNPDSPQNFLPDSNYLDKIYSIENDGTGPDTAVSVYTYDAAKRVVNLHTSYEPVSGTGEFEDYKYFYNNNDTLPYKSVYISHQNPAVLNDTTTTFFQYNSQAKRIKDSVIRQGLSSGFRHGPIRDYQYSGNKIYSDRIDTIDNGTSFSLVHIRDTATVLNNNVISNIHREEGSAHSVSSVITWDNMPSPFAKLSNFKTFAVVPTGETFLSEMPQDNNRLHITETGYSSGVQTYVYEENFTGGYIYKTNGYPKEINGTDGTGTTIKIIFVYKTL
jgi:hypothetical protein